jgi:hypothetical protein
MNFQKMHTQRWARIFSKLAANSRAHSQRGDLLYWECKLNLKLKLKEVLRRENQGLKL